MKVLPAAFLPMAFTFQLVLTFQPSFAQSQTPAWHSADERLSEPKNPSGYYASVNYFTRYDTIPCTYERSSGKRLRKGYKAVYVKDGYYTDDSQTFEVFFDEHFRRINHVRRYYFM